MTRDDLLHYVIVGAAFALAVVIRLRRINRTQRLRVGTLWIIPGIFLLLAAAIFWQFPPSGFGWLWVGLGFAAGAAIGWQRGRLVEIGLDHETGSLTQRSSPTAFLFLILLFALRGALRWLVELGDARWHLGAMLVSDIFIALAVGVLCFFRLELWLRARRLRRPG